MIWLKHLAWLILSLICACGLAAAIACGQESPVLLDFYADWCGPCQSMAPTVDQLASAGYRIERVNIDDQPAVARQYGVTSIPCFVIVAQGREIDRVIGVTTLERLRVKLRAPGIIVDVGGQPHPAWRYEHPVGYRAAVVRIRCQLAGREMALGSGVLVRWGNRVVVLTARHVIRDARSIVVVLSTGNRHNARVLVTSTWDCAVLQLDGKIEDVEPAEIVTAGESKFSDGDRLESCGYGGKESKLASNTGRFLGYKRSQPQIDNHDDWFEISGPARQGDSGGPIFKNGKVAGILWGTDGNVVVGVQAGRLGLLLNESVKFYQQQADGRGLNLVPVVLPARERNPSPMPAPDGGCCPAPANMEQVDSLLPWRQGVEGKLGTIDRNQAEINRKLDAILQQPQQGPPVVAGPLPPVSPPVIGDEDEPSLRERLKDRIKDRIRDGISGRLLGEFEEHPLKFALVITALVLIIRSVKKHREARAAGLPDPTRERLDALNERLQKVVSVIPGVGPLAERGLEAWQTGRHAVGDRLWERVDKIDDKLHQTALATPPPGQQASPQNAPGTP